MNAKRRKKRQLRNLICMTWCGAELLIVLLAFLGLGNVLRRTMESGEYKNVSGIWGNFSPESLPASAKEAGPVICLDAGHGGKDNGSDYSQRFEKDDNLRITLAVAAYLRGKNVTVFLTREDDTFVSLEDRCSFANTNNVDYFVSLHRNDGDGAGVEVWVDSAANGETVEMAQKILDGLSGVGIQRNRGLKKGTQRSENGDYFVNANTNMPSCIVELGFIGNAEDNRMFDEHLDAYAAAIGDAVLSTYEAHKDEHRKDGDVGTGAGEADGTGADGIGAPGIAGAGGTSDEAPGSDGAAGAPGITGGAGTGADGTGAPGITGGAGTGADGTGAPGITGGAGTGAAGTRISVDTKGMSGIHRAAENSISGMAGIKNFLDETRASQEPAETAPQVTMIDPAGKDNTGQDWGQGVNVDEKNRPVGALNAQAQYGALNALFIAEDTPTIYLTFDEGYECGNTESLLNTLKEKDVKAVFFVTQPYVRDDGELVQRMIDDGHVIGNHSVSHPAAGLPSQTAEEQQNEVMGLHNYMLEHYGYTMNLFRYPAGKFSEQSLAIVNNCGYKSVFWSFAYLDYDVENQPDRAESLKKMVDKLHPGAVYLLHAESSTNAAVLGEFIDQAREKGYTFGVIG